MSHWGNCGVILFSRQFGHIYFILLWHYVCISKFKVEHQTAFSVKFTQDDVLSIDNKSFELRSGMATLTEFCIVHVDFMKEIQLSLIENQILI